MTAISTIDQKLRATRFIDTHEHLLEESTRLAGPRPETAHSLPCDDWAYLFRGYTGADLKVAGMATGDLARFLSPTLSPEEKWDLAAPYWPRIRHTGYSQALTLTVQRLYGEDGFRRETVGRITDKMRAAVQRGYYRHILQEEAGVESCQVNSQEAVFCQTAYPDLLYQDLSTVKLSSGLDLAYLRRATGLAVTTLAECHQAIDWHFARYGAQAVATKNQSAYERRLNYADVPAAEAAPLFARYAHAPESLSATELTALQDHLWHYCIRKATEQRLPVKLHTGYYAGTDHMPLARVSPNLQDLCPILMAYPDTAFVIMHITYPYQNELVALAKQYSNVYVDLCWAWIISPLATKDFVKEFLLTAPANKLLTFGGDYVLVEPVVGHAEIARRGLAQALSELVTEGWLAEADALDLVEPLMRGNAWQLFRMEEKQKVARQLLKG